MEIEFLFEQNEVDPIHQPSTKNSTIKGYIE